MNSQSRLVGSSLNPRKPEQLHQTTDGVHRIELPVPLPGIASINSYVIESASGPILVDPGWATSETESILTRNLRYLGYRLDDVAIILITHSHFDHYTQAIEIRRKHHSAIYLGHEERFTVYKTIENPGSRSREISLLRRVGAEDLATTISLLPNQDYEIDIPFELPDYWLKDGETVEFGGRCLTAHLTAGHTRGHLVFVDTESGVSFTGDHILPHIVPSVGFEQHPEENPLLSYMKSLKMMLKLPDRMMLPAHGDTQDSVHVRAEELLIHLQNRFEVVKNLRYLKMNTLQIAQEIRWTKKRRRLEELTPLRQMSAIFEIQSYLDLGEINNRWDNIF